jgi:lipoate-protein ligase A
MSDLARYLKPKPAKLQKHGVQSVRSRVVNLAELNPEITPESIVPRLKEAFESEYSECSEYSDYSEIIKRPEVRALHDHFASDEWKYGRWKTFTAQCSGQFDWGGVELALTVDEARGIITEVQIASDALDLAALDEARLLLIGATTFSTPKHNQNPIIDDIITLVYK